MAFQAEQPFHERELRYFLAEILKASEVPVADLIKIIQDKNISPQWEQMALPNGRSLAACRHQFGILTHRMPPHIAPPRPTDQQLEQDTARRNRPPGPLPGYVGDPPMQPHHYQFAPINEPNPPAVFQSAPYASIDTSDRSGKKRGRPSKAERELREAEARARGEVYQPTKRKPKNRPSAEGVEGADLTESSSQKKPVKRTKVEGEVTEASPRDRVGVGAVTMPSPAGVMQLDTPERAYQSNPPPPSEPSRLPRADNLFRGMREQASELEPSPYARLPISRLPHMDTMQGSTNVPPPMTPGERSGAEHRPPHMPPSSQTSGGVPEARMT